jgi:hypothetical protein
VVEDFPSNPSTVAEKVEVPPPDSYNKLPLCLATAVYFIDHSTLKSQNYVKTGVPVLAGRLRLLSIDIEYSRRIT